MTSKQDTSRDPIDHKIELSQDKIPLKDQMNESLRIQEIEYRNKLSSNSSNYKLDAETIEYYNELNQQTKEKEKNLKLKQAKEIDNFKLKQQIVNDKIKKPTRPAPIKLTKVKKIDHHNKNHNIPNLDKNSVKSQIVGHIDTNQSNEKIILGYSSDSE